MDRVPLLGETWNWAQDAEHRAQQAGGPKVRPNRKDAPAAEETDAPEQYVLTPYDYPSGDRIKRVDRYYDTPKMYRYYTSSPVREGRDRRSSGFVAKLFVFSMMMISFLVLMYIPVYNKATTRKTVTLTGWSADTNRDTKVYVQPGNITLIHDVKTVCPELTQDKDKLYLLIVVFSATANFKERQVIRETWANYTVYNAMVDAYATLENRYSNYSFDYDLPIEGSMGDDYFDGKSQKAAKDTKKILVNNLDDDAHIAAASVKGELNENGHIGVKVNTDVRGVERNLGEKSHINRHSVSLNAVRRKRSLADVVPGLVAAALEKESGAEKKEAEEQRFEEDKQPDKLLPEFQMNKVLGSSVEYGDQLAEYDEPSNVMKIPPRGFEDESPNIETVIKLLKESQVLNPSAGPNTKYHLEGLGQLDEVDRAAIVGYDVPPANNPGTKKPVFKVVFLLGVPAGNDTDLQARIDEESSRHGDIVQENFLDSYNNLTLKSIMMLKWLSTQCYNKVRYVLKTDDDIFVNVPRLVRRLRERTLRHYLERGGWGGNSPEYYIAGFLIRNARPVSDVSNKWYSPPYMYRGRIYPRYLSGTGYLLTGTTVLPLYRAALKTPFFHLEDIFITGMCALGAVPRLRPEADETFNSSCCRDLCDLLAHAHAHRVAGAYMRDMASRLADAAALDTCYRKQLNSKRREIIALDSANNERGLRRRLERLLKVKPEYTVRKVRY